MSFVNFRPASNLLDAANAALALLPPGTAAKQLKEAIEEARAVHAYDAEAARAIEIVREQNAADDDIEIDDEPLISVSDDGIWVSAWLWVATPAAFNIEGDDE